MNESEFERPHLNISDRWQASSNALSATMKDFEYESGRDSFELAGSLYFYHREDTAHQLSRQRELQALSNMPVSERDRQRVQELEVEIQSFSQMLEQAKKGRYSLIMEDLTKRGNLLQKSSGERNQRLGEGLIRVAKDIEKTNGVGDPFKEPPPAWQDSRFIPEVPQPPPQKS